METYTVTLSLEVGGIEALNGNEAIERVVWKIDDYILSGSWSVKRSN
jgi:hypothetical protein